MQNAFVRFQLPMMSLSSVLTASDLLSGKTLRLSVVSCRGRSARCVQSHCLERHRN
jgi:hypothetical protein